MLPMPMLVWARCFRKLGREGTETRGCVSICMGLKSGDASEAGMLGVLPAAGSEVR